MATYTPVGKQTCNVGVRKYNIICVYGFVYDAHGTACPVVNYTSHDRIG